MAILQGGDGSARGGHSTGISGKRTTFPCATLAAFLTSASLGVLSLAMPAVAQVSAQSVTFDIPSQPVNEALVAFARQASVRLVMPDAQFGDVRSNTVRGAYDRETALAELLRGTGVAARLENGAIVLQRSADASRPTQPAAPNANEEPFQVAQATPQRTTATDAADVRGPASDETDDDADTVVIVGTNIRGVYPSSSPVETYTAEDIARTGATTTEQFVGKLTQNFGTVTAYGSVGSREAATGIDLRGLGVGTTLVLVNGRRMSLANRGRTADISGIPASAIERVEVLTDGASAIYGSDAIGGVVNFVLRDDFEGAETTLSYGGVTSGGLRQGGLTQTVGRQWGSGHGLVSYDFLSASSLDRTDRDYAIALAPGTLTPDETRHNLLATFSQDLTNRLTLGGDLIFSRREVKSSFITPSTNPLNVQLNTDRTREDQGLINLGLDYEVSDSTHASLRATYSENDTYRDSVRTRPNNPSVPPQFFVGPSHYTALDLTAMLDGALLALPGGDLRYSFGVGVLDEDYTGTNSSSGLTSAEIGRRTTYAFAELFAPLVGPEQDVPFVHRLELSLAARYTGPEDTSRPSIGRDFGEATDPKIGLLWAPTSALSLRGTYGTSFRAPSLAQLDTVALPLFQVFSGTPIPSPGGPAGTQISVLGVAPGIEAESAETYAIGFDFRPESIPGFELSTTYYSISYTDRIAAPPFPLASLANPQNFPEIWMPQPSAATIASLLQQSQLGPSNVAIDLSNIPATSAALAALPNLWLLDLRERNLALSNQDGLDVRVSQQFDMPWGDARVGANVTYILNYEQQAFVTAAPVSTVDVAGFPADLRGRVYVGLSRGGFDGTLSANYVDDYMNPGDPSGVARPVESWTTVDLSLAYTFANESGPLRGLRTNLSVQNLFDRDPPFFRSFAASNRYGFDQANANPLGRFVMIGLTKSW
jgi:iron complex outermembrane recepter protein